jgi:MFS family permease
MSAYASSRHALRQVNFRLLFASNLIKVSAENFASIAFVWLLLEAGGDAVSTSILYLCNIVPLVLFSLFFSPLLSRGKLTHWMFASDGVRFLILTVIPVCYLLDCLPVWLFFLSALLQSSCGAIYNPASVALLPKVVDAAQIQSANALIQSANQGVRLLGLAGAGTLVTFFSASMTLLITAFLFLISAVLLLFIQSAGQEQAVAKPRSGEKHSYWQHIREGFAVLRQHKVIYSMAVFFAFANVGVTPLFVLLAVFVRQELQADAAIFTMLQAAQAIGAILAGLVLTKVRLRRQGALCLVACLAQGVSLLLIGTETWFWFIFLCCFVFGMAMTAVNVPEMVIIQTMVPQEQQAKVFAIVTTISTIFLPPASLFIGPLAKWLGAGHTIMLGGIFVTVCGLAAFLFLPLAKAGIDEGKKTGQAVSDW